MFGNKPPIITIYDSQEQMDYFVWFVFDKTVQRIVVMNSKKQLCFINLLDLTPENSVNDLRELLKNSSNSKVKLVFMSLFTKVTSIQILSLQKAFLCFKKVHTQNITQERTIDSWLAEFGNVLYRSEIKVF